MSKSEEYFPDVLAIRLFDFGVSEGRKDPGKEADRHEDLAGAGRTPAYLATKNKSLFSRKQVHETEKVVYESRVRDAHSGNSTDDGDLSGTGDCI